MSSKPKIILDTHCFVNYWTQSDECYSFIFDEIVDKNKARLLFSQETIGELMYNIKKFTNKEDIPDEESVDLLNTITSFFYFGKSVNAKYISVKYCNDPDDDMFLEVAHAGDADYVVSQDIKSGIHKYTFGNFKVMKAENFVDHWKSKYEEL